MLALQPADRWLPWLPPLLFVLMGTAFFWNTMGDDLASSFVGCRVLATGHAGDLYSYDPVNFAGIRDGDVIWPELARQGGYNGYLHPYVQTPLWAWGLEPICTRLRWTAFKHLFLVLALLSLAGCVALCARNWTPAFWRPLPLTLVLGALALSEPFLFTMHLVQTHALLLLLTVAGFLLAERKRPWAAGALVACAAAVKLTPAVVLVYWLASRHWRAAFSFVAVSALLLTATRLVAGPALFHAYLEDMHRVSGVLLVAENNQSLAAWWRGRSFAPDEVFDVNAFALPTAVRLASTALMALCAALGGLLDRDRPHAAPPSTLDADVSVGPPFGAAITLVAMTIFAPIAWTHYFIVLVIPLMVLFQAATKLRAGWPRWLSFFGLVTTTALLYRPLAPDVVRMDLGEAAVLRGVFFAGMLCLLALLLTGWWNRRLAPSTLNRSVESTGDPTLL